MTAAGGSPPRSGPQAGDAGLDGSPPTAHAGSEDAGPGGSPPTAHAGSEDAGPGGSPPTPRAGSEDAGLAAALEAIRLEAAAVSALATRLGDSFLAVVDAIALASGRVVVTGLGKSGLVGRKIAATLASTGTPSIFVHAGDALHGDSGMVAKGDVVLALSASGETEEVCAFAQLVSDRGIPVVAFTGDCQSTLAQLGRYCLDVSVSREADPLNLAPTASTAATLAMGDALAAALMTRKGFTAGDFAAFHPGGSLGRQLAGGTQREQ